MGLGHSGQEEKSTMHMRRTVEPFFMSSSSKSIKFTFTRSYQVPE